jgi:hypothetical protein
VHLCITKDKGEKTLINTKKSLGNLRTVHQPSERHPRMTGTIQLQRHTLAILFKHLQETQADEVVANLAAWPNRGIDGKPFLSVEVSPRFVSKRQSAVDEPDPLEVLFNDDNEQSTSGSEPGTPSWFDL